MHRADFRRISLINYVSHQPKLSESLNCENLSVDVEWDHMASCGPTSLNSD